MKMIKCISTNIGCNIREAREKIMKAYEIRGEDTDAAMWFREMANAHLAFNEKGHNIVTKLINNYKMTDDYKNDPAYADGMMDVWNTIHADQVQETAEVRAMIDSFK